MLKVGYVPNSDDLLHPGDRRRLAAWALNTGNILNAVDPLDSDILVLSIGANLKYWIKRAKQPVVLDLVDGYIGENPGIFRDIGRNIVRSLVGRSNFRWITYTRHLKMACEASDSIIVASIEQEKEVAVYNSNVHIILDDQSELEKFSKEQLVPSRRESDSRQRFLFWEGFGYTLKHFQIVSPTIDKFLKENGWGMYLVTDLEFARWGGYIGKVKSKKLIKKWFPLSYSAIQIIPWSVENLVACSRNSDIGVIPIDSSDKFASLKSENKLLGMWRLGLPTLFSKIPSYQRTAQSSNLESCCLDNDEWEKTLATFSQSSEIREKSISNANSYLKNFHTHAELMEKWNDAMTFGSRHSNS